MASDNFERCLAITLKWEGGYSNHPDDPGGPTMRGIIQREYDAWRKRHGGRLRPVRQIEEGELQAIYRTQYWDAMGCEELPPGFDLCVFDAAVNAGVGRATQWLQSNPSQDIQAYCSARLEFLRRLGRLWRVFGVGWRRRINSVRLEAQAMAGQVVSQVPDDGSLHAGMTGQAVVTLQEKLRGLGYPAGAVDGVFGEQTYRAVMLFQHDHDLGGDPGIWQPAYNRVLADAGPMLSRRANATRGDLEDADDPQIKRMNLLQRIFAWLFGGATAAQIFGSDNVLDSISGVREALEPLQPLWRWAATNQWLFVCAIFVAAIVMIRLLRSGHVKAYQNFDYQGPAQAPMHFPKTEMVS